ncbi:MAG: type II restriction endonuclease [Prevotella sp.]|nr:type II restriction endonuclease [Prevotella sp.]
MIPNTLKDYKDLVTTHEQTRAGFISFALEKNRRATPIIEQAKVLHALASNAKSPEDLLKIKEIHSALLTASGLSDKAVNYFNEKDKKAAIQELIDNFLKPAGEKFVDELVYRYLLIKGDSLGGAMRNVIGEIAQCKLILTFISTLSVMGVSYKWYDRHSQKWIDGSYDNPNETSVKTIHWNYKNHHRVLAFNLTIPIVQNNIDLCLFNSNEEDYNNGQIAKNCDKSAIMFGELKGGIDPAGADEHWKTGRTALERIKTAFANVQRPDIKTAFIAAAIEDRMGREIYSRLVDGNLSYAANLTVKKQVVSFCKWVIRL